MTVFNTIAKTRRRRIGELQGLKMSVIQKSLQERNTTINIKNYSVDTSNYNSMDKISRRNYNELHGLLVRIVENSNRVKEVLFKGIKVVKPIKKYKNKIKLLFKYRNNLKH